MTNLKKMLAVLLCIAMLCVLCACGNTTGGGNSNGGGNNGGDNSGDSGVPAYVTGPITIEYWHNHGGELAIWLADKVKEFNETNEYGITVIESGQGDYWGILSKLKSSYGTAVNCNMAIVGAGGIEELAGAEVDSDIPHQGAFADLSAYVERDKFDLNNIPETLRYYMEHYEGKVIEFPFLVSTTVIYYNKAFFPEEPQTLEEWVSMSKEITKNNPGVYGMALPMDMGFIQRPILKSLGAPGLCTADGEGPAAELLGENSVLKTFLSDYRGWIEEGFCYPLNVTSAAGVSHSNAFLNGTCASYVASSAGMTGIIKDATEAGIEVGVCSSVGYGTKAAGLGGGGFAVMADCTQQEAAACWEFMKFLLSDENQIEKHKISGYLPFSYTAVESEELKSFWAEYPGFEVAYKTQEVATYNDWSLHLNEWRTKVSDVFTGVLVDGSLTVEAAIAQLEIEAPIIFS